MNNARQIEVAKQYIRLFVGKGEKKLCTPYGLKHKVEKYTEYFIKGREYISENSAIAALGDTGFKIDDEGYVVGEWLYPSFDTIVETIGNRDFEKHFSNVHIIPFYNIPRFRVTAMIAAHSSACENKGGIDFPLFESDKYGQMQWIEIDGGALAYRMDDDVILFDTIYVKIKRKGVGTKLFDLFLEEVSSYPDDYYIEIDAFTDDSIAFFEALSGKNNLFKPSRRLSKKNTYSIGIDELKAYKGIANGND